MFTKIKLIGVFLSVLVSFHFDAQTIDSTEISLPNDSSLIDLDNDINLPINDSVNSILPNDSSNIFLPSDNLDEPGLDSLLFEEEPSIELDDIEEIDVIPEEDVNSDEPENIEEVDVINEEEPSIELDDVEERDVIPEEDFDFDEPENIEEVDIINEEEPSIENDDIEENDFVPQNDDIDFIPENEELSEEEFVFKPQLSIGAGMLTFYGDIGNNNEGYHPMVSRIATTLRLINPLNDFLDVGFYVMFGEIGANERTLTRNLNFNSKITTGGVTFNYNFSQFLKKSRIVEPYIHVGFESIEFLSKTDLKDANGNTYHYWSDGSIMDMAEADPNLVNNGGTLTATNLVRDYTYESDIREQDFDGFGKYQERTFGVPLELGANLYTGNRIKFRVGTAMHFTFSDLLDGVTEQSSGNRVGTSGNDRMLFTHIAISYDFNIKTKKPKIIDDFNPDFEEYFKMDTIDSDGDLVVDHMDKCAKTPIGVMVDEYGCPVDDDLDGVPNSLDKELLSMENAVVNSSGVTMTDYDYSLIYKMYKDSTGEFSDFDTVYSVWTSDPRSVKKIIDTDKISAPEKQLFIVIGSDVEGVSANELWKRLANKDFQVRESGDSIMYVLGGYSESELAEKIKELENDDIDVQGVVEISNDNEITSVDIDDILENENNDPDLVPVINPDNQEASFRVQIGAFRRKVSKLVFKDLPDVVSVKGDDGFYRFFSGSFVDKNKAAAHKVDLSTSGYNDAFIVAFKSGKRVTLKEAGFEVNEDYKENLEVSSTPSANPIDSKYVKFRIQVGAYREKVPIDALDLFLDIGQVLPKRHIPSGLTKYYVGQLNSYQKAIELRDELVAKGLEDCFIVGEFKNKIISSKEALNLLGQ